MDKCLAKHEQVPALICDTYARRILCAAAIWGGLFGHREQNSPPKYQGNKCKIAQLNFIFLPPPFHNFRPSTQSEEIPPSKPIVSL